MANRTEKQHRTPTTLPVSESRPLGALEFSEPPNNNPGKLSAEALADSKTPREVRISPCGKYLVYSLQAETKAGEHVVSSLWVATVGKQASAYQLTSGESHDHMPQWSPDGQSVAFVSDRNDVGRASAVYVATVDNTASTQPAAARQLTDSTEQAVASFKWSPNGKFIAFLQPDTQPPDPDPYIYQPSQKFNRLRCLDVGSGKVDTLFAESRHVHDLVWNGSSDAIVFTTCRSPDFSSPMYYGTQFARQTLNSKEAAVHIGEFGGEVEFLTLHEHQLYFTASVIPKSSSSAQIIWRLPGDGKAPEMITTASDETVSEIRWTSQTPAVLLQKGLKDEIALLNNTSTPIYSSRFAISTWDLRFLNNGKKSLVLGMSSCNTPVELYSVQGDDLVKLTNHGHSIAKLGLSEGGEFFATAQDGTLLDGVLFTPLHTTAKPWPTVVFVHGGPYDRINISFTHPATFHLGPWLAAAGYAVLFPNYRGGSGRGQKFANPARGGVGTVDYDDIIAMVKAGIDNGTIDKDRVAIGGWSQGGFLSYLAVTRSSFKFRAAVCGAGVTDWDMLVMSSDFPALEEELAGGAPWVLDPKDIKMRSSSAIWHMAKVDTPVLILHGEKDERIPLSQAIAFYRGCEHYGHECEMVVYPREPHLIMERKHTIDMLERIKKFYDKHIG